MRGRLWRASDPALPEAERQRLVGLLMDGRRAVRDARDDPEKMKAARAAVQRAKVELGERGPVWWNDGAPDWNRTLAKNTPYAEWAAQVAAASIDDSPHRKS